METINDFDYSNEACENPRFKIEQQSIESDFGWTVIEPILVESATGITVDDQVHLLQEAHLQNLENNVARAIAAEMAAKEPILEQITTASLLEKRFKTNQEVNKNE